MTQSWSVPRRGTSSDQFTISEAYEHIRDFEQARQNFRDMEAALNKFAKQAHANIYADSSVTKALKKMGVI